MPVSPAELLELLQLTVDGVGLPVDSDNVAAVGKLLIEGLVDVVPSDSGLRVRLAGERSNPN